MKKALVLVLIGCMLFALSSCGAEPTAQDSEPQSSAPTVTSTTPSEAPEPEYVIGVLVNNFEDSYISNVREAIASYTEASPAKITLDMQDGQGDHAKQLEQMDELCEKKVDAILLSVVDIGEAQGFADKAKAADIPLIFFSREPSSEIIKSYDKCLFVGTSPSQVGVVQGEMFADLWNSDTKYDLNGDGKCQYVVLQEIGRASCRERV